MAGYKKYARISVVEMRPLAEIELELYKKFGILMSTEDEDDVPILEIEHFGAKPKMGDMIARSCKAPGYLWLVPEEYFKEVYKPINE